MTGRAARPERPGLPAPWRLAWRRMLQALLPRHYADDLAPGTAARLLIGLLENSGALQSATAIPGFPVWRSPNKIRGWPPAQRQFDDLVPVRPGRRLGLRYGQVYSRAAGADRRADRVPEPCTASKLGVWA